MLEFTPNEGRKLKAKELSGLSSYIEGVALGSLSMLSLA